MKINSLCFRTELFFHRFTGTVVEHEYYLVVKTPSNPTYFWGNLLYFKNPPNNDSIVSWQEVFQREFQEMKTEHMTFAWDSINGEIGEAEQFVKLGFQLEKNIVMISENIIRPPKINDDLIIRPIESDEEWKQVLENHVQCRAEHFEEIPFRKFAERKIADYRVMIKQGKGFWMGAFLGGRLAGDLGLFSEGTLGRFQLVGTHPDFRRMGVCSTLVYKTCLYAREKRGVETFVMVADPTYHAANIYRSVGFLEKEISVGVCKYNKKIWVT